MNPRPRITARREAAWRLLASCLLVALAAAAAVGARAASSVRPPRLSYTVSSLPNGLRIILLEDHSAPIVNVQVWYHVGSKDERAGRTGFAHLFEHMMFKGSKNVDPEEHTSVIASVGGQSNAYTTDDETVFWQTLPAQFLLFCVWSAGEAWGYLRGAGRACERTYY